MEGLKVQMERGWPLEIEEHAWMTDEGVVQGFLLYKIVCYFRVERLEHALHEIMISQAA